MDDALFARLEKIGEAAVLREIALGNRHGTPDSELRSQVEAWLRLKELERANSTAASAAAMERQALRIAASAKNIAIAQIIVSAITAIVAVVIGAILSKSS